MEIAEAQNFRRHFVLTFIVLCEALIPFTPTLDKSIGTVRETSVKAAENIV